MSSIIYTAQVNGGERYSEDSSKANDAPSSSGLDSISDVLKILFWAILKISKKHPLLLFIATESHRPLSRGSCVLNARLRWCALHLCLPEDDLRELLIVESPTSIAVIDSEEVLKIALVYHDSDLCDCLLEGRVVDLACILVIEEFE